MSELDDAIHRALETLGGGRQGAAFDYEAYIAAFRESAQKKAAAVLGLLAASPFAGQRPVFVSIGGGDGEELETLLRGADANCGVLIEYVRQLADAARRRNLPNGRKIEVFEGDAQAKLNDAIQFAIQAVLAGQGDYIAVTCHAVLHELFDRSEGEFDPMEFFATIFQDEEVPTWFSYREPGEPEGWPPAVLLSANCHPRSLLKLAEAISSRHQVLRELKPRPMLMGDHVRLPGTLAMETLAKLFYLADLSHEIEERSTAVQHEVLKSLLLLAVGRTAGQENRAQVRTMSSPTDSFVDAWADLGVEVVGISPLGGQTALAIPESQTRVVAWRLARFTPADEPSDSIPVGPALGHLVHDSVMTDITIARRALDTGDDGLLVAILASGARAWIESSHLENAVALLREIVARFPSTHPAHLWSHYALALCKLFSQREADPALFSGEIGERADVAGLGILFRAEFMEALRKSGEPEKAIDQANALIPALKASSLTAADTAQLYVIGTANCLVGNLLRSGGLYSHAWTFIDEAQSLFRRDIPSHETELAHCYYGQAVCTAMTGVSDFSAPFHSDDSGAARQFAHALIALAYSHAAWLVDNVTEAIAFADDARQRFLALGYAPYGERASRLATLLRWWETLRKGEQIKECSDDPLLRTITELLAESPDVDWLLASFPRMKPSHALGVMQFAREYSMMWRSELSLDLPPTLVVHAEGSLAWREPTTVSSLEHADHVLRQSMMIPLRRRLPLLAD